MAKREAFSKTRLIVAEGYSDTCFAVSLTRNTARRLGEFDISSVEDLGNRRGKDGFRDALIASEAISNFHRVSDVVILTDNDENPAGSFQSIKSQIENANAQGSRNWGIPDEPGEKAAGDPSVSVWMFPEPDTPGCFETLLWRVIEDRYHQKADCVLRACQCVQIHNWPVQRLDKAKVRAFLALEGQPERYDVLWRDNQRLIPLGHAAFTRFCNFLRQI